MRFLFYLLFSFILSISSIAHAQTVEFQTYVTAGEVEPLFGAPENCKNSIAALKALNIKTVYLETIRGTQAPSLDAIASALDALQAEGFRVSAGIATIFGEGFGIDSNRPGIWLNYQAKETQHDLADHISKIAPLFDELIVDDFLATDDESDESIKAKGDQTWSEYRLNLMTKISKDCIIAPARKANPDIRLILKYPQWYDRFHRFGYNVETGRDLYDLIWVGTETRNPDTKRFGYVQPTQGFINYSYLKSFAGDQMGGAWFDFGDCTPGAYLMQAYQSVMAGARELNLFEAGSVVANNECLAPFQERQPAIVMLGEILNRAELIGIPAYKPAHSEASDALGGANLYIYDYLAYMGLTPIMINEINPGHVRDLYTFLPRQAADDPNIINRMKLGGHWLATPDFIQAIDDYYLLNSAGYSQSIHLDQPLVKADKFWVQNKTIDVKDKDLMVRKLPWPDKAKVHVAAMVNGVSVPILFTNIYRTINHRSGLIRTINFPTFRHEEFGPDREQFLPPRPLSVTDWPDEVVQEIQKAFLPIKGIHALAPNGVSIYQYHKRREDMVVFSNFSDKPKRCSVKYYDKYSKSEARINNHFVLYPGFPHKEGTTLENETVGGVRTYFVNVMPWEIAVVKQDTNL